MWIQTMGWRDKTVLKYTYLSQHKNNSLSGMLAADWGIPSW